MKNATFSALLGRPCMEKRLTTYVWQLSVKSSLRLFLLYLIQHPNRAMPIELDDIATVLYVSRPVAKQWASVLAERGYVNLVGPDDGWVILSERIGHLAQGFHEGSR